MKKGRVISIVLLCFVLGVLFINRDKLVSFAKENNINILDINSVVKNGTSFLLEENAEFLGETDSCVHITFRKEDYSRITNDLYCVNSSNSPRQIPIENDYADYWILIDIYRESYGFVLNFMPYEYKAPEYQLECAPEKIKMDTYATCTVKATTYYSIDNIEFDLNLDDFIIYDEVKLEDVDEFNKNKNHYVLVPKHIEANVPLSSDVDTMPFTEPVNIKLMEFKIKTEKEQEVAVLGNIKLNNLKYTDVSGNASYKTLTATVGQDTKKPVVDGDNVEQKVEEKKENPKTVDIILIVSTLFVISLVAFFTVIMKRKKISN